MSDPIQGQWQDFEKIGEVKVRQQLASNIYNEDGARLARVWLEHQAEIRDSEEAAWLAEVQSEQLSAATRAADASVRAARAAELAADAAERQSKIAERATKIAIAALTVAIISAVLSFLVLVQLKT